MKTEKDVILEFNNFHLKKKNKMAVVRVQRALRTKNCEARKRTSSFLAIALFQEAY